MAHTSAMLTVNEYERLYGNEPGWEYWFGEARRKAVPTQLHGILATLLAYLLHLAGYASPAEGELRLIPDWRPRPDVYGTLSPGDEYPTNPESLVVFEVQSEGEDVTAKSVQYASCGIQQIFVFEPEAKLIHKWNGRALEPVLDVELLNGATITGATIWSELEKWVLTKSVNRIRL